MQHFRRRVDSVGEKVCVGVCVRQRESKRGREREDHFSLPVFLELFFFVRIMQRVVHLSF